MVDRLGCLLVLALVVPPTAGCVAAERTGAGPADQAAISTPPRVHPDVPEALLLQPHLLGEGFEEVRATLVELGGRARIHAKDRLYGAVCPPDTLGGERSWPVFSTHRRIDMRNDVYVVQEVEDFRSDGQAVAYVQRKFRGARCAAGGVSDEISVSRVSGLGDFAFAVETRRRTGSGSEPLHQLHVRYGTAVVTLTVEDAGSAEAARIFGLLPEQR